MAPGLGAIRGGRWRWQAHPGSGECRGGYCQKGGDEIHVTKSTYITRCSRVSLAAWIPRDWLNKYHTANMAPNSFSLSTRINVANGLSIPQIHLGVYLMSGKEAADAVKHALSAGYRAVDSAQMYRNEAQCGKAIQSWLDDKKVNTTGLKREDIFFTSKLASNSSYESARRSIRKSVETCGLGYIDLFLLHSPYGGKAARLASWKAVEDAIDAGEVKIGGVSNVSMRDQIARCSTEDSS